MSKIQQSHSFSTHFFEIKRLCGLARLVAQGDSVSLDLYPGVWSGLVEPLIAEGVLAHSVETPETLHDDPAAPYRIDGQTLHSSDTMTVAVPVLALDGTAIGRIRLHQARPDALSAAITAQLRKIALLLAARLVANSDQDADLPQRMLTLIEALAERDTEAGSRVVTGFLRLVAGQVPSKVEAMRLCIAGLAEPVAAGTTMPHPSGLRLTSEAGRILGSIGLLAALPVSQHLLPTTEPAPLPEVAAPAGLAFRAIANLSLGKSTHDIGESDDETALAYRPAGSKAAWTPLVAGLADGWPEIATEIMLAAPDAQKDYVFTHMIHDRQKDGPQERAFSLYELRWRLRIVGGALEGCLTHESDPDWRALGLSATGFDDNDRELAYAGLQALLPELDQKIGPDVRAWLRRLATGATVVPIFMPQSA